MEDPEGGLNFDFEGGLEAVTAGNGHFGGFPSGMPGAGGGGAGAFQGSGQMPKNMHMKKSFRQTVCRHWLRGLCMKGSECGFLHQFDKLRMPLCRFFARFGECREPDCIYKHSNEDIRECNMYKLGFCPNGPDCRYRHEKLPGPPPPVEQNLAKIQQRYHSMHDGQRYYNANDQHRYQQQKAGIYGQSETPPQLPKNTAVQGLETVAREEAGIVQPSQATPQSQAQAYLQTTSNANGVGKQPKTSASLPLPYGYSRYFIVKSSNRENLELSVERGVWATHRNNEGKLNEAFDSCDNVILIFSVNETRHFQGCARMMSKAGSAVGAAGWKYAQGTAHYGRNFRLKWLKLCELSFQKTRHLRNPYNENLPVKISRDCQELETTVGEQLAALLYMEADSELMMIAKDAEAKREEEKAKGGLSSQQAEDPNIVPFEDNDDEQEEDDSEDDAGSSQTIGIGQGRGKGRGQNWPQGRGDGMGKAGRGMRNAQGRGMYHNMGMGAMSYGMGPGEAYMMPGDIFAAPPTGPGPGFPYLHPAASYGTPDFANLGPASMMSYGPMDGGFHGRPPNGMFLAPGSMGPPSSLMGGAAQNGVPGRPFGMPFRPPYMNNMGRGNGRGFRNQQRKRKNDRSVNNGKSGMQPSPTFSRPQQKQNSNDEGMQVDGENDLEWQERQDCSDYKGNAYDNNEDDSDSEDEAPRRSRHGEGKKRRRDWGTNEASGMDHISDQ